MSVGHAYARALFETAQAQEAKEPGLMNEVEFQFGEWVELVSQSKELAAALGSPLTSLQEKLNVVNQLSEQMKLSSVLRNFLVLLAKKGRLSALDEIHDSWNLVRLEAEGGVQGVLVSAHAMDQADIETLVKAFSDKLGKKLAFRVSTDPTLLAGIKVTVNGVTYDGSLRSQLQKLHDHLVAGAPIAQA